MTRVRVSVAGLGCSHFRKLMYTLERIHGEFVQDSIIQLFHEWTKEGSSEQLPSLVSFHNITSLLLFLHSAHLLFSKYREATQGMK